MHKFIRAGFVFAFIIGLLFSSQNVAHAATVKYPPGCTATTQYSGTTGQKCSTGKVLGDSTTAPSITSLYPASGPVGASVQISGSGFTPTDNTVNFGTTKIFGQTSMTACPSSNNAGGGPCITYITFTVPQNINNCNATGTGCGGVYGFIQPGDYPISVTNANSTSNAVNFTVTSATNNPSVTVLSPNGGEYYQSGGKILVTWTTNNVSPTESLFVTLHRDADPNNSFYLTAATPNDGKEEFVIPYEAAQGSYKLRIGSFSANIEQDYSDNMFSLSRDKNATYTLSVASSYGSTGDSLITSPDNGIYCPLYNSSAPRPTFPGTCLKLFPIDTTLATQTVTLTVTPNQGSTFVKWTDDCSAYGSATQITFTMKNSMKCNALVTLKNTSKSLTLIYPQSGDTLTQGQYIDVRWSTTAPASTYVGLSIFDGNANFIKAVNTPNDGQERIRIPLSTPTGQYKVYYYVVDGQSKSINSFTDYVVFNVVASPIVLDLTPRIAYWYGKVNQHVDSQGNWLSDPDGRSGANIDKLTYCKKWYPSTTKVEPYMKETITTWKREIIYEQSNYTNTVTTDKCGQGISSPSITVVTPNGGEVYSMGQVFYPQWKVTGMSASDVVTIELQDTKDGKQTILGKGQAIDGSVKLAFPMDSSWALGNRYKLRITAENSMGNTIAQDFSDDTFTIKPKDHSTCDSTDEPWIEVFNPNGGEIYQAGGQIKVKWETCNVKGNVNVSLNQPYSDNGFYAWVLGDSYPNSGFGTFTIPTTSQWTNMIYGKNFKVFVGVTEQEPGNRHTFDQSDNLFTINDTQSTCSTNDKPWIKVISPNGGEVYQAGQQVVLKWTSCNLSNLKVRGLFSYQNGSQGVSTTVTGSGNGWTDNDGQELITVPMLGDWGNLGVQTQSGRFYKLYMETFFEPPFTPSIAANDFSDDQFTIKEVTPTVCNSREPSITVLSPNGGEVYKSGQQIKVSWNCGNNAPAGQHVGITLEHLQSDGVTQAPPDANGSPVTILVNDVNGTVLISDKSTIVTLPNFTQTIGTDYYRVTVFWWDVAHSIGENDYSDHFFRIKTKNMGKDILDTLDYGCQGSKYSTETGNLCSNYQDGPGDLSEPIPVFKRTLKVGTRGKDVEALQKLLNIKADGIYGRGTAGKVKLWQVAHDLPADGAFGAKSAAKLNSDN